LLSIVTPLFLPTESVAFGQFFHTQSPEHVKQLRPVMHAVSGKMNYGPAKGFFSRWFVEGVKEILSF
jgi:hypothetical protein